MTSNTLEVFYLGEGNVILTRLCADWIGPWPTVIGLLLTPQATVSISVSRAPTIAL